MKLWFQKESLKENDTHYPSGQVNPVNHEDVVLEGMLGGL